MSFLTAYLESTAVDPPASSTPPSKRDLNCSTHVDVRCSTIDPRSAEGGAQALQRRLQIPRGTLIDDASVGYDLLGKLNKGLTQIEIHQMESAIQAEAQEVDAIDRIALTTTRNPDGVGVQITAFGKYPSDFREFNLTPAWLAPVDGGGVVLPGVFFFGGGSGWGAAPWGGG